MFWRNDFHSRLRFRSVCPSDDDWLLKIIAIENRFVLGLYRREMKAISYLGKVEKLLGVPATNRNWNTIQKVAKILETNELRKVRQNRTNSSSLCVLLRHILSHEFFESRTAAVCWHVISVPRRKTGRTVLSLHCQR